MQQTLHARASVSATLSERLLVPLLAPLYRLLLCRNSRFLAEAHQGLIGHFRGKASGTCAKYLVPWSSRLTLRKSSIGAHGQAFHFQDVCHYPFYSVTSFYAGFRKRIFCCVSGCILTMCMGFPHQYRVNGFTVLFFKTESGVIFEGFCEFTKKFVWPEINTSS